MFKKAIIATSAISLIFLTACSFTTNKYEEINSLNYYIDLINTSYDEMDYLRYQLFTLEDEVLNYDTSQFELAFNCPFVIADSGTLYEETLNPSSALTAEEQEKLTAYAQDIIDVNLSVEESCKELVKQVVAQDYKEDDFMKVKELLTGLYSDIDSYYGHHQELLDYVNDLFKIYETWEVDESDPISVAIGNVKYTVEETDELTDLLREAQENQVYDNLAELEAAYESVSQKWTSESTHDLDDANLDLYYGYFYDDLETIFLPVIKRSIRDYSIDTALELEIDYSDSVDAYNILIDDYNAFLAEIEY